MRIAITGSSGQLGTELQRTLSDHELILIDIPAFDITDPEFPATLYGLEPDLVLHAAAMTHVDGCARDPEAAFKVNETGTRHVALGSREANAPLIYISTNEVFDGKKGAPYLEDDPTGAINPYGASKLAGEEAAAEVTDELYIVRVAWVFSPGGNNFPSKILQRADETGSLKVVTDEVANPTYAPDLAEALGALMETGRYGTYHLTNEGLCSRYDYAVEILKRSGRENIPIAPITGDQFERPSTPPAYAALENRNAAEMGIRLRPWQDALDAYLRGL